MSDDNYITLQWITPPPEPDANGEIAWSINNGDGSYTLAMKHVETGVVRVLTIGEFMEQVRTGRATLPRSV